MVHVIDREAVQDLLAGRQAQLIEVLPPEQYEWAHLPGAVNVPLPELAAAAARLDRSRPVIVYCHDGLCDMSSRAAHRLERLGFAEVCDYAAGKLDWLCADLPYEGNADLVARRVRRDPVTAHLEDPLEEVADRVIADPAGLAVVVDEDDVVQGVIGACELEGADQAATAEDAMCVEAPTVRPSEGAEPLVSRMDRADLRHMVVTKPDGTLVGLFGIGDLRSPESEPDRG